MFAVDSSYAADDIEIGPNAEVACIPPVSGG
jgi:molybdopterin converting factor small subunit